MDCSEFKSFLEIMILMGVTRLPNLHNYWPINYQGAPHIVEAFPRNRFMRIFNDNSTAVP